MARDPFPFNVGPERKRGFLITLLLVALVIFHGAPAVVSLLVLATGYDHPALGEIVQQGWSLLSVARIGIGFGFATGAWALWAWRRWGLALLWSVGLFALSMEIWKAYADTGGINAWHVGASVLLLLGPPAIMSVYVRRRNVFFD